MSSLNLQSHLLSWEDLNRGVKPQPSGQVLRAGNPALALSFYGFKEREFSQGERGGSSQDSPIHAKAIGSDSPPSSPTNVLEGRFSPKSQRVPEPARSPEHSGPASDYSGSFGKIIEKSRSRPTASLLIDNFSITLALGGMVYIRGACFQNFLDGLHAQPIVIKLDEILMFCVATAAATVGVGIWSMSGIALIERGVKAFLNWFNFVDSLGND